MSSLRSQSKRIDERNRVAISIRKSIESNCIGEFTGNNIRIDESLHLGRVVTRSHIDETIRVSHDAISAVIAEEYAARTRSADKLTVSIVCESIGNIAAGIGDGNGAASAVKVVGLEGTAYLFANQTSAVDILGCNATSCFHKKLAQLGIGVVSIGRVLALAKIANSYVLCVVGVGMAVSRKESICGIVGEALYSIIQHIVVRVVAYRISFEDNQPVVGVIAEAAVGRIGNVTRRIVVEGLGRNHRIVAKALYGSCGHSIQVIISIAHFGTICKCI